MANQIAARLSGDDYQHLYAWFHSLELKMPSQKVRVVRIEDPDAASVDDVTVVREVGAVAPDAFHQVKYHVDQRGQYSTAALTARKPRSTSLLEKFWKTWRTLRGHAPGRSIELYLVSNWAWDSADKLRECIGGPHNGFTEDLFRASPRSRIGQLREKWRQHLSAADEEFAAFARSLRFKLGFDCADELKVRVAERMENLRLKHDEPALLVAAGIVREWIKAKRRDLTLDVLEDLVDQYDLRLPPDSERWVTVHLVTIKEQKFELPPDHLLDWRGHFVDLPGKKGHQLKDPADWNGRLLPELHCLEQVVNEETDCRLVRVRGLARLTAWFALGHVFSQVARYTLEVDQQGQLWRTDATPNPDLGVEVVAGSERDGEVWEGDGDTVAVGVSVTGPLEADVREYLESAGVRVSAVLFLRPNRELRRDCLRSAGDVVALADGVKIRVREFVKRWRAKRTLLFYFGPLSGACFIGHQLNAVCHEIQIMEDQQPGYAPSFCLH